MVVPASNTTAPELFPFVPEGLTPTATEVASPFVSSNGGTRIFYRDWGSDQSVVFSHGWPLTADAWDDQIVPIGVSTLLSSKLVKGWTLKVCLGFSHGMCTINKGIIGADLLAFIKAKQ